MNVLKGAEAVAIILFAEVLVTTPVVFALLILGGDKSVAGYFSTGAR